MPDKATRRCTRCVMDDSSDGSIVFDEDGHCNYCTAALAAPEARLQPQEKQELLDSLLAEMRAAR